MERSKAKKEREEEMVFIGMVGHHTVPVDHYVLQSIIKHAESIPFTLYSMCATIGDKKTKQRTRASVAEKMPIIISYHHIL